MARVYHHSEYYIVHSPKVWTNEEDTKNFDRISSVLDRKQAFSPFLSFWNIFGVKLLIIYLGFSIIILATTIASAVLKLSWTSTWMLENDVVWWVALASIVTASIVAIPFTIKDKKRFENNRKQELSWIRDMKNNGKAQELFQRGLDRINQLKSVRLVADGLLPEELEEWRSDFSKIYSFDILDKRAAHIREVEKWLETFNK